MEQLKHSGLGIAAFITSLASSVLIFILIILAGAIELSTPGGIDENSVGAMVIGLLLFAFLGAALLSLGLGIGALFQRDRKKVFAILGTVFASVTILGTLFVLLLGMAME